MLSRTVRTALSRTVRTRSFYTSDRFADVPIPPSEDWEAATGEVCPSVRSLVRALHPTTVCYLSSSFLS